jgi:hypothetical protein
MACAACHAVGDDLQVAAALAQRQRLRQLAPHMPTAYRMSVMPAAKNCSASFSVDTVMPCAPAATCARHLGALAGLHVRPKAHAQLVHARLHAVDVALHARQRR